VPPAAQILLAQSARRGETKKMPKDLDLTHVNCRYVMRMCATRDIAQGEELSVDFHAHLPDSGISACRPAPDAHARVSVC
jgi:hypothetical protein